MVEVITVSEVVFVVFALRECGLTAFYLTFSATKTYVAIIMVLSSFVVLESKYREKEVILTRETLYV